MSEALLILDTPFSPEAAAASFRQDAGNAGAIVTFTGLVRGGAEGATSLELQHFPGFTETTILAYVDRVTAHWPLTQWRIIHRVGEMAQGEPIVFVATAATHRRAAFEAADCLMDMLKSRAPFWKKEVVDAEGKWIEPRAEDMRDLDRWKDILGD